MFTKILLPTDGSPLSDSATVTVIEFAKLNQAAIVAVSVVQPLPFAPLGDGSIVLDASEYEHQMRVSAQHNLDKVQAAARAADVPFDGVVALSPSPYEEIVAAASKFNCDIIIMASHGRKGLNKLFIGSETQKVLAHTTLPVMVLR
ncbi:universal stress protein [Janthinobacterium agaricidamnosum]|uniref:Universal stress family protein n=1 Tax=Janthinobacterium agaricidamnosum NBRC 102515 = DSM 9628 TaxID=1349767 RepID=W0V8Y9_9BURK|nr:universal stress protein [Janthinobacterium agaricidamnosum]CDG85294.1 universal stress family protein [Janthinobacterium agaricidamnosum NBRC 102515 = DSM 9628]